MQVEQDRVREYCCTTLSRFYRLDYIINEKVQSCAVCSLAYPVLSRFDGALLGKKHLIITSPEKNAPDVTVEIKLQRLLTVCLDTI